MSPSTIADLAILMAEGERAKKEVVALRRILWLLVTRAGGWVVISDADMMEMRPESELRTWRDPDPCVFVTNIKAV